MSGARLQEAWRRARSRPLELGPPAPVLAPALLLSFWFCSVVGDLLSLGGRADDWPARAAVLAVVATFATAFGLSAAAALFAVRRLRSTGRMGTLMASAGTLGTSIVFATWIIQPSVRAGALAYWLVTMAIALGVWATGWVVLRLRPREAALWVAAAVGGVSAIFDFAMDRSIYAEFHTASQWLTVTAVSCGVARIQATHPELRWGRALVASLVILPLGYAASLLCPDVHRVGTFESRWFNSLHASITGIADSDRDGFSRILWGGDCDDTDSTIFPGAADPPDDGVDRNCNGVVDVVDNAHHRGLGDLSGSPCYEAPSVVDRVLLIVLDTFRPEALHPEVMPATYRYFESGTVFSRTYANATSTYLSMPYFTRPDLEAPPIRDTLREAGVGYDWENEIPALLETLGGDGDQRSFIITHRLEMHDPYVMWPETSALPSMPPIPPAYLSEAQHLDGMLAPLWRWLDQPSIAAHSLVIVTGDHGEGAGEHGVNGHTRSHWEEVVRVPLAIRGPGLPVGRIDALTSTRGIPATILGAFGLCEAAARAERFGASALRTRSADGRGGLEFALIETSRSASGRIHRGPEVVMVSRDRMKLVFGLHDGLIRMFDLENDPEERVEIAGSRQEQRSSMRRALARAEDLGGVRPQLSRSNYLRLAGQ